LRFDEVTGEEPGERESHTSCKASRVGDVGIGGCGGDIGEGTCERVEKVGCGVRFAVDGFVLGGSAVPEVGGNVDDLGVGLRLLEEVLYEAGSFAVGEGREDRGLAFRGEEIGNLVERFESQVSGGADEVGEDFVNPVTGLGSADCRLDAEAGMIQKESYDFCSDVASATEDDGGDVFRHEFLG
jgi:hypothetical protein